MIRAASILCILINFVFVGTRGYAGTPSPRDFDVFIEAESALATYGFGVNGPPRGLGYSGGALLDLWRMADPKPPGYYAEYAFDLRSAGNFYIVIWVQALDTPYSSPFELRLDKRTWTIGNGTAKPLPAQLPYGEDMTGYFVGPAALGPGRHNLSIVVNTRRAYRDHAYNLLADAIALTNKNPSNSGAPLAVSLTVDAACATGSFSPLTDLSQGGISEVADPAFWETLCPIINDLGASFVRIDHIFDDGYYGVLKKKADGSRQYDWRRLDAVVSEILKTCARPFFCLSYMPAALSRDGTPYQAPANLKDWEELCRRLVLHMKTRFNLAGLNYEVWNEPDLEQFWKGSQSDYFELYRATTQAIKDGDPSAKVGGPAVSSGATGWLSPFLQFVKRQKLQLDFVSWHLYSRDPAAYSSQIDYVKQTLSALNFPANLELLLSEWNSSDAIDVSNDAFYNAGRTAAVLSILRGENVARAFFFMPKDARNSRALYGGWGLVTWDGRPKPSYDCLDAFNRMRNGEELGITSTDGSVGAVGVIKGDSLKLLLWNYSGEQAFGRSRNVKISFNLAGTPFSNGTINQSEYVIDSRHSRVIQNHDAPNLQLVASKSFAGKRSLEESVSLEDGGVMYIELRH